MPAMLRHFAINAEDVSRARAFYEKVFGWEFKPWGPPDFYQVQNAGTGLQGALQKRHDSSASAGFSGFMTTFGVDDIGATLKAVEENGGRVVMQPYKIEGVGEIAYIQDSEGNTTGIGQYEPNRWE